MKKIWILLLMLATAFAVVPSCNKDELTDPEDEQTEQPDDEKPDEEGSDSTEVTGPKVTFLLTASLDESVKDVFDWSADDVLTAWAVDASGKYGYDVSDRDVTASSADGDKAVFAFTKLPSGGKTWLAYNSNTGYDGCSAMKVEFNHTSSYTQPTAGVLPASMVKLISSEVAVPVHEGTEDATLELEAKMTIAGALLSYDVTSGTGVYDSEKVASVQIVSLNNFLASAESSSAYAYNMLEGGKYWLDNDGTSFGDDCALIWENTSRSITTTVTGQAAVSEGKAVYMPAPPVKVGGYKMVVCTDLAFYTFDCQSENLTLADHKMTTVALDLEKARRIGYDEVRGELCYEGGLPETLKIFHKAKSAGIGYWYARTKDKDSDEWVTREANVPENAPFYQNVTFSVIDDATGAEADWLTISYRQNDTWWDYDAKENTVAEPRSATVTAIFSDVSGYLIQDGSVTKTTKIIQAAYTDLKTLGFLGGIGDSVVPGAGAEVRDLGYCVITVDEVNAEDWNGDSHNEQALYGNVEIVCREGSAEGPVVDWLTVGYGKDAEGRHNSTHIYATASENTGDAPREALVCCTYTAPDGYQFEDGATSAYKQFKVRQPSSFADREIAFWGGLASEYTHDSSAQTGWGLSYCVITVDGTNATDWTNDSSNEQTLYGAAEFKCYDYTDGVRGAEIDWVTVDYKNENGRYIDTWWLADIQENTTGAVRKAEVVCTFPQMTGYTFKDGQNTRSTVIVQNP